MHYILYKTTNNVNGKFYIGMHKTKDINDGYFGSGKLLKRAIQKYGTHSFTREILQEFQTEVEMLQAEAQIVNEDLVNRKDTYNIVVGGKGGFSYINREGLSVRHITKKNAKRLSRKAKKTIRNLLATDLSFRKHMQETRETNRQKMMQHNIKYGPPFLGKKHTAESRQKISLANKGRAIGKKNSQFGTMWITNGTENKKVLKNSTIPESWTCGRTLRFGHAVKLESHTCL